MSWEDSESDEDVQPKARGRVRTKVKGKRTMANEGKDDLDLWEDDSDDNNDSDDDEWDDENSDDPLPAGPAATTAPKPPADPAHFNWDDESDAEEEVVTKKVTKSKAKQRKQRIRNLEKKKEKRIAERDADPMFDTSDEDEEVRGPPLDRYAEDNEILFGGADDRPRKQKVKIIKQDKTLRDLYPIANEGRRQQKEDIAKLATDVCDHVLDHAMEAEDQRGKKIHPRIKPHQVKDFICMVINKLSRTLDATELAAVRGQADAEIAQLRARERDARQAKRRGRGQKQSRKTRKVYVEEQVNTYVDGEFNGTDFEDIF